ncbi:MAG TPA: CHAT domain-containing protein [Candidatus Polarisedimenticolia bacterium]|jgi:CHAT domain-containing protein|nr:CHAT domain-containing protein [Candidatus Polarisedimenticolia bacterium]
MRIPPALRAAAGLGAAIVAIFLATVTAGFTGEDDAPALIEKTRALLDSSDIRSISRLVAADRAGTYEAVDRLLNQGDAASRRLEDALSEAYAAAFRDESLRQRIRTFRAWTPAQRAERNAALGVKNAGKKEAMAGRFPQAIAGFAKALPIFRRLGDLREEARCLSNLGGMAAQEGDYATALTRLGEAKDAVRKSGDLALLAAIESNRSLVYSGRGQMPEARTALQGALEVAQTLGLRDDQAAILLNLANLEQNLGQTEAAIDHSQRAAQAGRALGDAQIESLAWQNLGVLYSRKGERRRGDESHRRGAEIARKAGLWKEEAQAWLSLTESQIAQRDFQGARRSLERCRAAAGQTNSILTRARVEMAAAHLENEQGHYEPGLTHLDAAQAALQNAEDPSLLGRIHGERAAALFYIGRYEETVSELTQAIRYVATASEPGHEALYRMNLGQILSLLGEPRRGISELESASRLYRGAGDRRGEAMVLQVLGLIRFQLGEPAAGREALEAALKALRDTPRPAERAEAMTDLAALELASGHRARAVELVQEASRVFEPENDLHGIAYAHVVEAEALLQGGSPAGARAALGRIRRLSQGRPNVEFDWKILHLEGRVAESTGDLDSARRSYERSVSEVERLRSSVRPLPWRAAVLEDRIAPYRSLVRLSLRRGEVEEAYRVARAAKARTFAERLTLPDFASGLPEDVASRSALSSPASLHSGSRLQPEPVAPLDRLQRLLRARELMLDYFVADQELLVFVIRREALGVQAISLEKRAASWTGALETLRHPGRPDRGDAAVTETWKRAAALAGRTLLEPVASELLGADQLLVVPAGPLQGAPFGALLWRERPVIERWSVSILPAAESLFSRAASRAGPAGAILAMANPGEENLPGAEEEARRIARLAAARVDVLTGASAREAVLRRSAGDYEVIHLAAHGRLDPLSPLHSYLALSPGEGEDGRLEAGEIAALPIRAALVVLSGCETAVERGTARGDAPGEERTSLARAFLSAGAGTVIASLWEMEDRSALSILPALYPRLSHSSPAAALAELQRDLIHGRIAGAGGRPLDHPFYWAGLAAFGAGGPEAAPERDASKPDREAARPRSARSVRKLDP